MTFKPLLASTLTDKLTMQFPYLASPKLDGIRCVIKDGVALSRTLKPIPNKHIQSLLGNPALDGLDGEIICGRPTHPDAFRNTTKVVMSFDKIEDFVFHVFDHFTHHENPFLDRLDQAEKIVDGFSKPYVALVPHQHVFGKEELLNYETTHLALGFEGVMLRDPKGVYKYGRNTPTGQTLIKVKRFSDGEALVTGFTEQESNENPKFTDELGNSKRSTHQAGKVGADTLGMLVVKDIKTEVTFGVGTGFSAEERKLIWDNRDNYAKKIIKYKHFPVGAFEKPRFPVFLGWRDPIDI